MMAFCKVLHLCVCVCSYLPYTVQVESFFVVALAITTTKKSGGIVRTSWINNDKIGVPSEMVLYLSQKVF